MTRGKIALVLAVLWTLLISTSCLLPASSFKAFSFDTIISIDKLVHFTFYSVFFVLWSLALGLKKKRQLFILMAVTITFGVLIEILQATMSLGRSYELDDIIANTIGSVLGLVMLPFIRRMMPLIKKYLPFLNKVY